MTPPGARGEERWTLWICDTSHVPFASSASDEEFDYETRDGCPTCGNGITKREVAPASLLDEVRSQLTTSKERVEELEDGLSWILWTADGGRGSSTSPKVEIARKAKALLKSSSTQTKPDPKTKPKSRGIR